MIVSKDLIVKKRKAIKAVFALSNIKINPVYLVSKKTPFCFGRRVSGTL
jgi:hypothetical protein